MAHTQARLLVANYMKNGYNVVVEGPFYYRYGPSLHRFEQDIDQLVALMRQMTSRSLMVHLTASEETIKARAAESWREDEADEALEIARLYKQRASDTAVMLDTSGLDVDGAADVLRRRLLGG